MSISMSGWKIVNIIILAILVVGFILYKIEWRDYNIPTNDVLTDAVLKESGSTGAGDNPNDEEALHNLTVASENEIVSTFKSTENLRQLLLDKHLQASELLKTASLIHPKTKADLVSSTRASNSQTGGGGQQSELKPLDSYTSRSNSKVTDRTVFTDLPNHLGNTVLPENPYVCQMTEWQGGGGQLSSLNPLARGTAVPLNPLAVDCLLYTSRCV